MAYIRKSSFKFIKDPGDIRIGEILQTGGGRVDVGILGVPWDGATGTRPGSRAAPSKLRQMLFTSTYLGGNTFRDFGDVDAVVGAHEETWRRVAESVRTFLQEVNRLVVLGGDSTCSYSSFRGLRATEKGGLTYVMMDAHPDLREVEEGLTSGLASKWIRETDGECRMFIVGVRRRSNAPYLFENAKKLNVTVITMDDIESRGVRDIADQIADESTARAAQLSFNPDVLDPAFAPGVNSISAGGLTTREATAFMSRVSEKVKLRILDIVEYTPAYDHADITAAACAAAISGVIWPGGAPVVSSG